jgi:cytochrome c oxidase subunit 2
MKRQRPWNKIVWFLPPWRHQLSVEICGVGIMQLYVLVISFLLMVVVAAVFWWVVRHSAVDAELGPSGHVEGYRSGLFWGLVVLGIVVAVATLRPWPYDVSAADDVVTVTATGSQWSWEIVPREVPVGRPIIFKITSNDVNHGFGVYDPEGTMVFQTQAMPGYVNQVRYTFTKAGQYRVLCMEYCGLVHHNMIDEIEVK